MKYCFSIKIYSARTCMQERKLLAVLSHVSAHKVARSMHNSHSLIKTDIIDRISCTLCDVES